MNFVGLPLAAVIGIASVAGAGVVVLYLLKSTPKPQPVSNVDFWLRAVEKAKPTWVFSHRIPLIAMLLTLLAALLIVGIAGDPRLVHGPSTTTVVILDAGRTMEVGPEGARRIDQAHAHLRKIAGESTRNGQVALLRAGVRASVLVPLTRNPQDLANALDGHMTDHGPSDLDGAMTLADLILNQRPSGDVARVVLISDRFPVTPPIEAPLTFVPVGENGQTVAIVAFDARRDPTALGEYKVHCEIAAFTRNAVTARLVIRDRDVVLAEEDIDLAAGERVVYEARGFASDTCEVTAQLDRIEIDGTDDVLASDNQAVAVVEPLARTRVLMVTRGNRFLEGVLRVNPAVDADRMAPEEYDRIGGDGYDVVILDRHAPPAGQRSHPGVLIIGPGAPQEGLRLGLAITRAEVTSALNSHPVLDAVELDGVSFSRATPLLPEPEDRPLFRSERHVLATARDGGGTRRVVLGFALDQTDLVEGAAFPLLMHNAIIWLANQETVARSSRSPGVPLSFSGRRAEIELPTGEIGEGRIGAYYETGRAGVYHIDERPYAYSSVGFNGPLPASQMRAPLLDISPDMPLTLILTILLLVLLTTEWVLFHRGHV